MRKLGRIFAYWLGVALNWMSDLLERGAARLVELSGVTLETGFVEALRAELTTADAEMPVSEPPPVETGREGRSLKRSESGQRSPRTIPRAPSQKPDGNRPLRRSKRGVRFWESVLRTLRKVLPGSTDWTVDVRKIADRLLPDEGPLFQTDVSPRPPEKRARETMLEPPAGREQAVSEVIERPRTTRVHRRVRLRPTSPTPVVNATESIATERPATVVRRVRKPREMQAAVNEGAASVGTPVVETASGNPLSRSRDAQAPVVGDVATAAHAPVQFRSSNWPRLVGAAPAIEPELSDDTPLAASQSWPQLPAIEPGVKIARELGDWRGRGDAEQEGGGWNG